MKNLSRFDLGIIIAFVVLTLLGVGAWYYVSSTLVTAQQEIDEAKQSFDKYSSAQPFLPSAANQKILEGNIEAIKSHLNPLIESKLLPQNSKLAGIEKQNAVNWKHDLDAEVVRLTGEAKTRGVVIPPKFYFGFSRYLSQNPNEDKTIVLTKQLLGIEQLAGIIIDAPVKGIRSIRRTYDEETVSGSIVPDDFLPGTSGESDAGIFTIYPFEIDFEATTDSLRKVVNDLQQSPYVFVIRSMTIQNSHPASPQVSDLDKMVGEPSASVVDSSPGEVAATTSTKGPQFLFGAETIRVKARIDMIEWKGLPVAAKDTP